MPLFTHFNLETSDDSNDNPCWFLTLAWIASTCVRPHHPRECEDNEAREADKVVENASSNVAEISAQDDRRMMQEFDKMEIRSWHPELTA